MEEKSPSAFKSALGYGIYIGMGMVVLNLVLFLFNMHMDDITFYLMLVLILVGVTLTSMDYRNKKLGGYMTYGQAVKIGFLTILMASFVYAVYQYIFYIWISPGDLQQIEVEGTQEIYRRELDPEQEAASLELLEYVVNPLVLSLGALIRFTIFGLIISLFTGIFLKKEEKVTLS